MCQIRRWQTGYFSLLVPPAHLQNLLEIRVLLKSGGFIGCHRPTLKFQRPQTRFRQPGEVVHAFGHQVPLGVYVVFDQLRYFFRETTLPQKIRPQPLMIDCAVTIHVANSCINRQQVPNVVQKSGNDSFLIGPSLFSQLGRLQRVFELRYWLPEIRIVTVLGEEIGNHGRGMEKG